MIIPEEKDSRLSFFKELYDEAEAIASAQLESMDKYMAQYKGDKRMDGSDVDATQVRNITYELVESQMTSYIPTAKVTPKMQSERNTRCAKAIETLLANKRDELSFEKLNDMDERFNPIYGGSVWLIEWDESIVTHHTVGDVKASCLPPTKFIGQPYIYEVQDMEYCFVKFETTKEDIVRRYGVDIATAEETTSENADDKTATLYVGYYKDADDKVCQFVWSDETVLLDIKDYYSRKREVCKVCGKRKELCDCKAQGKKPKYELQNEEYEELDHDITLSDGSVLPAMSEVIEDGQIVTVKQSVPATDEMGNIIFDVEDGITLPAMIEIDVPKLAPTKIPFYAMSVLPIVIRKNTSAEDSLFGQSDCEFIRPQQQGINRIESRILEKLISGGVYPLVPKNFDMELDNSIFKKVFRAEPNTYNQFGRVDLQVDISRDVMEAERLYDQAKRILGITDSYQGQYDSSAQSGKAKQLQIQQAAGRLDSKRQMKNAAYAEIDKIIFQYYLAYADEPRPAAYKDRDGRMQNVIFSRYDFIERDESGTYYYNDEYLFSTDSTVDVSRSREVMWQENRQNFQSGAYGDPALPQTQLIFWLNMEKAHYPGAQDNVERIREEIEKIQQAQMAQALPQTPDYASNLGG